MHWEIHPPRPWRFPFALGQSLGPRGAKSPPLGNLSGLGCCIFRYIPPLVSVRTQYFGRRIYYNVSGFLLHKTLIPNLSQDFGHITAAQRSEPVTHGFCAGDPLERLKLCQVYTHHRGTPPRENASNVNVIRFPCVLVWRICI